MVTRATNIDFLPDLINKSSHLTETEIRGIIDKYLSNLSNSNSNFQTLQHSADIFDFIGLVFNIVRSAQASENIPENKRLLLLMDDPPEEIDTEAITFTVDKRLPGQINQGPAGSSSIKEVTPHLRSSVQHPEHLGEKLVTLGKFYDNIVSFNFYAKNTSTVLKRIIWFEDLIDKFNWYFRLHYVRIIEQEMNKPEKVTIKELDLFRCPVKYFVKTERIYQFGTQELRQIVINVNISNEDI